jgi:hypothetical protein
MDDDRKTLVERVVDATNDKVTRVQNEVNPVVSATRDRATAVRNKAQQAANALPLATREDISRLQDSVDRIEAALADLAKHQSKPAARKPRPPKPKPVTPEPPAAD